METEARVRRDLRSIVADGVAFSIMVGLGETYVPAFVLALGHGDRAAGLVATLPLLVGSFFQLAAPAGSRWLGSYRRWVVGCAVAQALSFLPLVLGAALGRLPLLAVFAVVTAYWAFGTGTSPAWNAWVATLIPVARRTRFLATRTRLAQLALLLALLAAGFALHGSKDTEQAMPTFALLFCAAALARLLSASFLRRQSEEPGLPARHEVHGPWEALRRLRRSEAGRILVFMLSLHVAVNVAAPYFTPFMLRELSLSYGAFTLLTSAAFLARVAILPVLGRVGPRVGLARLVWIGGIAVIPLPALWLVSSHLVYLTVLQLAAGAAWATLEFAILLAFFERVEERERASVLAVFNVATALAVGLGAVLGALVFGGLGGSWIAYAGIFALSSLGRLAMLPLLRRTRPPEARETLVLRTLAVRPSAGAVDRPVLAALGATDPDTPPDPPRRDPRGRVDS